MSAEHEPAADPAAAFERVQAVKRAYADRLMQMPNVVGLGIGYRMSQGVRTDQIALIVLVRAKQPLSTLETEEILPRELEGVPVDVQEVSNLRAQ
ncbi:MAG TPA: hypothetical protein VLS48_07615 [Anaerolineales bacterium]|nr:hypothetical protein [Anaerolineales bacterium]